MYRKGVAVPATCQLEPNPPHMNWLFVAASLLTYAIAVVHSGLGEHLIFRRMRSRGFIPTDGGELLRERHVRILWASWHLVSIMGSGMAVLLLWLATPSSRHLVHSGATWIVAISMLASSLLVLVATRGRHPGWIGLLCVAVVLYLGMYA
jgi:hypothetical protein